MYRGSRDYFFLVLWHMYACVHVQVQVLYLFASCKAITVKSVLIREAIAFYVTIFHSIIFEI